MNAPEGKDVFESLRMKARKLAALAARGVGGEREAAAQKLQAFLARHGLTLESLEAGERRWCELECVHDPVKPTKDRDLLRLAAQCLVYVVGSSVHKEVESRVRSVMSAKGRVRRHSFWVLRAELTEAEFKDWSECFTWYAPAFVKSRQRLRRALRQAFVGFIYAHDIFPPPEDDSQAKTLTADEWQALRDAMRHAEGDAWQRPAGKLQQGGFLLK